MQKKEINRKLLQKISFPESQVLEWKPYVGEQIVKCFHDEQWLKILPEIRTDGELKELFSFDLGMGYVLYERETTEAKGFVYLHISDANDRKVFIHGGGWSDNTLFNYTAMVAMIDTLFNAKIKIRSSCLLGNNTAFRFLRSLGFVNYYTSLNHHYFWLPYKRYINNPIKQRFSHNSHQTKK